MRKQIEPYQNGFKIENPDPKSDGNVDPTEPERAVKNRIRSAVEGDGKWNPLAHDIQKRIIEPHPEHDSKIKHQTCNGYYARLNTQK